MRYVVEIKNDREEWILAYQYNGEVAEFINELESYQFARRMLRLGWPVRINIIGDEFDNNSI